MQFTNIFIVPQVNTSSGLPLLWKADCLVDVRSYSENHIDAIVDHGVDDAQQFTGFYGDPDIASWENSRSLLRALSRRYTLPWICIGDFTEILLGEEKLGWLD